MRKAIKETLEIKSTVISVVTYQKDAKQLSIEFVNGRIYIYKGVPLKVFDKMRTNKSAGKYFNSIIKNNYECETTEDFPFL